MEMSGPGEGQRTGQMGRPRGEIIRLDDVIKQEEVVLADMFL
jgi:hypothetical protein